MSETSYQDQLWNDAAAFGWLRARGLEEDTIWVAGLGYVGSPQEGHERFKGAICIPYFDAQGRPYAPRFRHLGAGRKRKYDQETHAKGHPYGVDQSREPTVYVTEGEFDALILRQMGFSAVGIPGAQAWQRHWRMLFRDCDLVVIVMDPDEAGEKAKARIAGQLSQVVDVRTVELPSGLDVNELYLKDPDNLRSLL